MKKTFIALGLASLLSLGATEFKIDSAHSNVGFQIKHLLVSNVMGNFDSFSGKLDVDPKSKKINVLEGEIQVSSINTKNQGRDNHLKGADFFDTAKFPKGYFKMTRQVEDKVYGTLTLKGVSKEVVFEVEMSDPIIHPKTKKETIGLELSTKINRKDFQIGSGFLNDTIGDSVKITINLEASVAK